MRWPEGLLRLLAQTPPGTLDDIEIDLQDETALRSEGMWVMVRLDAAEYAIWKETGDVYRVVGGEVEDDPFISLRSIE